ncbi:MAG: SAM-dependent methyltransferase [Gammaproteobacteria bacterium]|nr:MAG: SAM-dependent methyltransferase [Gammaproteobacteria bacterium]
MNNEQIIAQHYHHGSLLAAIVNSLEKQNKNIGELSLDDLAPIDEFHLGGRVASKHFLSQLNFSHQDNVLDIGCGLGGAARFIAHTYQSSVTGIDLTQEYIDTGNEISKWLALAHKVQLKQASALSMPFEHESFTGAFMMHVGMNIEDKQQLFNEVNRVLKKQAYFGIYDVMQQTQHNIIYPVPWASAAEHSFIASVSDYEQRLSASNFEIIAINDRKEFALNFFQKVKKESKANRNITTLGVHTLMKSTAKSKINNLRTNIENGYIAPIEIIVRKK